MRKSKKRVISIITCCFVLATFCVGVFADEVDSNATIDPNMSRIGTVVTTTPYDLGNVVYTYDDVNLTHIFSSGYYIVKVVNNDISNLSESSGIRSILSGPSKSVISTAYNLLSISYYISNDNSDPFIQFTESGTYYIYVYIDNTTSFEIKSMGEFTTYFDEITFYSISDRSVIDSVYANSQDVNGSIVSVINEATNVITTNDVVMMFCILIPVISFGVGILIRLRKRA